MLPLCIWKSFGSALTNRHSVTNRGTLVPKPWFGSTTKKIKDQEEEEEEE